MGGRKSGMCLRTAAATPAFNNDDGATKGPQTHQQRQIQPGLKDHQKLHLLPPTQSRGRQTMRTRPSFPSRETPLGQDRTVREPYLMPGDAGVYFGLAAPNNAPQGNVRQLMLY